MGAICLIWTTRRRAILESMADFETHRQGFPAAKRPRKRRRRENPGAARQVDRSPPSAPTRGRRPVKLAQDTSTKQQSGQLEKSVGMLIPGFQVRAIAFNRGQGPAPKTCPTVLIFRARLRRVGSGPATATAFAALEQAGVPRHGDARSPSFRLMLLEAVSPTEPSTISIPFPVLSTISFSRMTASELRGQLDAVSGVRRDYGWCQPARPHRCRCGPRFPR